LIAWVLHRHIHRMAGHMQKRALINVKTTTATVCAAARARLHGTTRFGERERCPRPSPNGSIDRQTTHSHTQPHTRAHRRKSKPGRPKEPTPGGWPRSAASRPRHHHRDDDERTRPESRSTHQQPHSGRIDGRGGGTNPAKRPGGREDASSSSSSLTSLLRRCGHPPPPTMASLVIYVLSRLQVRACVR